MRHVCFSLITLIHFKNKKCCQTVICSFSSVSTILYCRLWCTSADLPTQSQTKQQKCGKLETSSSIHSEVLKNTSFPKMPVTIVSVFPPRPGHSSAIFKICSQSDLIFFLVNSDKNTQTVNVQQNIKHLQGFLAHS